MMDFEFLTVGIVLFFRLFCFGFLFFFFLLAQFILAFYSSFCLSFFV